MKKFRVEVKFKAVLRVSWIGAHPGTSREFDQYRYVDLTPTTELRAQHEARKFMTSHLVDVRTGMVQLVVDDASSYRLLKRAIDEARKLAAPVALAFGDGTPRRRKK